MDWASAKAVDILYQLLPGFLAAWVFYGLTSHPRRDAFERVVQALIFTLIIKGVVILIRQKILFGTRAYAFGLSEPDANLIWSLGCAVILGLAFAFVANTDVLHSVLRRMRITRRTSLPSQWYSAFRRGDRWVVLHLCGGRRLHGWAEEWPDSQEGGHFLMLEPKWLLDTGESIAVVQTYRMIIKGSDVEMVEQVRRRAEVKTSDEEISEQQKGLFPHRSEKKHGK